MRGWRASTSTSFSSSPRTRYVGAIQRSEEDGTLVVEAARARPASTFVKNLYGSLSVYDNYDSNPPSDTDRRNDFDINSSLGWTF